MYKVMIVEDEMLVRVGIKHSIDWEKYNMSVAADLSDGLSALAAFREIAPHLVITDIRMPGLDGIELIKEIRKVDNNCAIIILSCVEELDLARQAMQLGVSEYLLKATMSESETHRALLHVKKLLDERYYANRELSGPIKQQDLQEQALRDYLVYGVIPFHEFSSHALSTGLDFLFSPFYMSLMEIDNHELSGTSSIDTEKHTMIASVRNITREKLLYAGKSCLIPVDDGRLLVFFSCEANQGAEKHVILQDIRAALYSFFNISVTFATCFSEGTSSDLPKIYHGCQKLMQLKYLFGYGRSLTEDSYQQVPMEVQKNLSPLQQTINEYYNDSSDMKNKLYAFAGDLCRAATGGKAAMHLILIHHAKAFAQSHANVETVVLDELIQNISTSDTMTDAVMSINSFILKIFNFGVKARRADILKAIEIIKAEYMDDLTMRKVAARVGLSVNYFSSLFSQETGHNFVSFLNTIRINKAKELLKDMQLYFYEIAERIGFTDEAYFSRLFKRETGLSPSEWRRRYYE